MFLIVSDWFFFLIVSVSVLVCFLFVCVSAFCAGCILRTLHQCHCQLIGFPHLVGAHSRCAKLGFQVQCELQLPLEFCQGCGLYHLPQAVQQVRCDCLAGRKQGVQSQSHSFQKPSCCHCRSVTLNSLLNHHQTLLLQYPPHY